MLIYRLSMMTATALRQSLVDPSEVKWTPSQSDLSLYKSNTVCLQAQKGQMEQQLAEMAEKMRQLKTDNSKIASRNSTLERVLQFREGEIAELQEQNRVRA